MENSTISKENHMVWKCDRTGIYSIFEYVPDLSAKACSISMSPLLVKWAIHMFINRIIMAGWMAGWLLPSTLWYFTQALFTILPKTSFANQRDLAHGWPNCLLTTISIKVGFSGKNFQVNHHSI